MFYHDTVWIWTTCNVNMSAFVVGKNVECEELGINVLKHLPHMKNYSGMHPVVVI